MPDALATTHGGHVSENPGCLGAILRLFGIGPDSSSRAEVLPYCRRDDFLSAAELSFYRALVSVAGGRAVACPKVNLADIFFVMKPNENQAYRNKIDRKHVDFLLCSPQTMRPLLGVELDDKSHQRADRQARDEFVNQVFETAGLPLLHVRAQASYNVAELSAALSPHLMAADTAAAPSAPTMVSPTAGPPTCPKCGIAMVLRTASRGERIGESFYGCSNYPRCRETVTMESPSGS